MTAFAPNGTIRGMPQDDSAWHPFTGRYLDYETGLFHYRARHYNPYLGRFLQRDPAGYIDGPNLYEYVRSRPGTFTDPTGKLIHILGGALFGGFIGGTVSWAQGDGFAAGWDQGVVYGASVAAAGPFFGMLIGDSLLQTAELAGGKEGGWDYNRSLQAGAAGLTFRLLQKPLGAGAYRLLRSTSSRFAHPGGYFASNVAGRAAGDVATGVLSDAAAQVADWSDLLRGKPREEPFRWSWSRTGLAAGFSAVLSPVTGVGAWRRAGRLDKLRQAWNADRMRSLGEGYGAAQEAPGPQGPRKVAAADAENTIRPAGEGENLNLQRPRDFPDRQETGSGYPEEHPLAIPTPELRTGNPDHPVVRGTSLGQMPPSRNQGPPPLPSSPQTLGYYIWETQGTWYYVSLASSDAGKRSGIPMTTSRPTLSRSGMNPVNWHHVEIQAASVSRENGIPLAFVVINNTTVPGMCNICRGTVPVALGGGKTLVVVVEGALVEPQVIPSYRMSRTFQEGH